MYDAIITRASSVFFSVSSASTTGIASIAIMPIIITIEITTAHVRNPSLSIAVSSGSATDVTESVAGGGCPAICRSAGSIAAVT